MADYLGALEELEASDPKSPTLDHAPDVEAVAHRHSSNLQWDSTLISRLRQRTATEFSDEFVQEAIYRPFVKQYLYADNTLAKRPGLSRDIFPNETSENRAICLPGVGSAKPFSALMVDTMPDIQLQFNGQCFPRYRYVESPGGGVLYDNPGLERIDNISDTALRTFRSHYQDGAITKDDLFDYAYGVLHAPDYRQRFANDLAKGLPRVPYAPDFHTFAEAGRALAALHLGYESCEEYPLEIRLSGRSSEPLFGEPDSDLFRIGTRAMRFKDEETTLIVNDQIQLCGIPAEAHRYEVNGRTPLGWFIDRYRVTRDKRSGIVNDPNGWFADPRDLITAIRRIVYLSVETVRIVEGLREPFNLSR